MKKWEHLTKEEIDQFVQESSSFAQLANKIGYDNPRTGSAYRTVHQMIDELNLDISHFTGQNWSKGKTYQNKTYMTFDEYIKGDNVQSNKIRKKLLREGLKEHKCECCQNAIWNGQPIPLEVHHKDGDKTHNELENLQLLCPNCHALTDNYKGKNTKKYKENHIEASG